jgi:hypothetical protein
MSDGDQGDQDPSWLPGSRRPTRPRSAVPRRKAARAPVPRPDSRHSSGYSRKKRGRGRKPGGTRSAADLERELAALRGSHEQLQAELEAKEMELDSLRSASHATPTAHQQHTSDSVGTPAPPPLLGALSPPTDEADQLLTTPQSYTIPSPLQLPQVPSNDEEQPLLVTAPPPAAADDEDEGLPMAFFPFAAVTSPRNTLFSPTATDSSQHRTAFSDWRPRDSGGLGEWGAVEGGWGPEGTNLVHLLMSHPVKERSGSLTPD